MSSPRRSISANNASAFGSHASPLVLDADADKMPWDIDRSVIGDYAAAMATSGMIVLAIGSALGTTIAIIRNPELFHPDKRKSRSGSDTATGGPRLRRKDARDRDLIDR